MVSSVSSEYAWTITKAQGLVLAVTVADRIIKVLLFCVYGCVHLSVQESLYCLYSFHKIN